LTNPAPAGYDWAKSNTYTRYTNMRDALLDQNRTILYSLCDWGQADVNTWGNETGNSWRMSGDISGMSFPSRLEFERYSNQRQHRGTALPRSPTKTASR
jgi:hypothetical protein